MRYAMGVILLLLLCGWSAAEVTIDGPATAEDREIAEFAPKGDTSGPSAFQWRVYDSKNSIVTGKNLKVRGNVLEFVGMPGTYTVELVAAVYDDKAKKNSLVLVRQPFTVTGPPVPPLPPDPLPAALQAAYTADADAKKADSLKSLAALYRQGVNTADNAKLATWGDLVGVMHTASAALLPITAIAGVRKAIAADLATSVGTDGAAELTAEMRAKVKATFTRIATALENIKP